MNRQRGFGDLIMLLVYAAIAAAVLGAAYGAWRGFTTWIGQPFAEAQRKADQVIVDKAGAAQKKAEADTLTAQGNEGKCQTALGVSNESKDKAEKTAKANLAESAKAKAQSERERAVATPYIAGLQADAAAKANRVQTCEESLAKADKTLTDALCRARPGQPGCK